MVSFPTLVHDSHITTGSRIELTAPPSLVSSFVRLKRQPSPDEDRPAPDRPGPSRFPDRWDDWGDKILPDVGPHGPGGGEPVAPEAEPDTHDSGRGEP
jgi:hypothetical protein